MFMIYEVELFWYFYLEVLVKVDVKNLLKVMLLEEMVFNWIIVFDDVVW